jgi:FkbM family methyltransferase
MDIGANFGLFTRFLSESAGPGGSVHSFEPTLAMSRVLNHNVKALPLGNVTTSPFALSDRIGSARIKVPVHSNRAPNYYEASLCIAPGTTVGEVEMIETTTLDAYCEANCIKGFTFIRCDVEGHEIAVLNGARRTLERFRPAILLEVNELLHEAGHGADVRKLIESLDYGIHVFENGAIRPWRNEDTFVNYVLLPGQTGTFWAQSSRVAGKLCFGSEAPFWESAVSGDVTAVSELATPPGFEPEQTESKSVVLPLHHGVLRRATLTLDFGRIKWAVR